MDSSIKTVYDLTHDIDSPYFAYADKEEEFGSIVDEFGVSNKERIFNTYFQIDKNRYKEYPVKDLPLRTGTKFVIPMDKVDRNGLLTEGLEIVTNSDVAFKSQVLAAIEGDKGYVAIQKPISGKEFNGSLKEIVPDISVWIWCRALSSRSTDNDTSDTNKLEGTIFDISPFVSNLNVTSGENGGNFQITLPPLVASMNAEGNWVIKENSLRMYSQTENLSLNGQGYVAEASLYDENMQRNNFLFHHMIKSNDLVFIRFETLHMEKDRLNANDNLKIDKSKLAGNVYDMIGLVDMNANGINFEANDSNILINGRDLTKLFIDDGTYFYALEQSSDGKLSFAGSASAKNGLMQRIMSSGANLYINLWQNTSIQRALTFIINQLSNIKIVPDELLDSYENRNTVYKSGDVYEGKSIGILLEQYKSQAIASIKQLRIKNGVNTTDSKTETDMAIQLFEQLKNFMFDIREVGARTVTDGETDGWKAFTWSDPKGVPQSLVQDEFPNYFDGNLYRKADLLPNDTLPNLRNFRDVFYNIDSYLDIQNSQGRYKPNYYQDLASGIWQIIKLVIDSGVSNRRLVDASMSTSTGSLINFVRKVCQSPFVEAIFDTNKDIFTITVRKPPTDQIGVVSMLEGAINTEDGRVVNIPPAIIDIEAEDVLREDLAFSDIDVYSWYHLTPKYNIGGNGSSYPYFYLPALFFQPYADIWGSRPMDIFSNYMPYIPLNPSPKNTDLDLSQKQAVYDLKYLVESNQMNPFTRRGTIVMNGDRRIKRGNLVRYKPTGEIFKVDTAHNNHKIGVNTLDRTTTLYVSRGMVEQLIYGIPYGDGSNQEQSHISYFNIINTTLNMRVIDKEEKIDTQVQVGTEIVKVENAPISTQFPSDNIVHTNMVDNMYLLDQYNSEQRKRFIQLINAINEYGYQVIITSGVRTYEEQSILYKKNNAKVHNAKPGTSKHESGDAIDINIIDSFGVQYFKSTSVAKWVSTGIPRLAASLGFLWGGDSFNNYYDPVHFQIKPIQSGNLTKPVYETKTEVVHKKYLDQSAIFNNFKVNNHVFNFFLRGEQFNKSYNTGNINRTIYNPDTLKALRG